MRRILAVVSDTHGGHKFGLCNPDVTLYDEDAEGNLTPYSPQLTAVQGHLWELYLEGIGQVVELAGDDPVTVIHVGDPTHGNKHPEQLMSTRAADQLLIAAANWAPWFEQVRNLGQVRLTVGTGSHEFGEGSASILIADALMREYGEVDIRAVYHGLADIGGVTVDYAHHGPGAGIRSWLHGNNVRYYLRDLMMREVMRGNQPPDLVLRGHVHTRSFERVSVETAEGLYESAILVMPAMCMLTDYARQVTRSVMTVTNGIAIFEILEERLSAPTFVTRTVDVRTKEVL